MKNKNKKQKWKIKIEKYESIEVAQEMMMCVLIGQLGGICSCYVISMTSSVFNFIILYRRNHNEYFNSKNDNLNFFLTYELNLKNMNNIYYWENLFTITKNKRWQELRYRIRWEWENNWQNVMSVWQKVI